MSEAALILDYNPAGRARRRLRFEPYDDAGADWLRIEEVHAHDGDWRQVGSELVDDVTVIRETGGDDDDE